MKKERRKWWTASRRLAIASLAFLDLVWTISSWTKQTTVDIMSHSKTDHSFRIILLSPWDSITGIIGSDMFELNMIRDWLVITVMYFDAYLKSRNLPNPHLHSQVIHPPSNDFASKFTTLRPPLPQSNPVIGKQTYHEQRNDSSKLNTSAHIYLSTNKPNPIPQRNAANYQGPPSTASGPLGPFSRHQFT